MGSSEKVCSNGWILKAIETICPGSKASLRVNGQLSDQLVWY